MIGKYVNAGHGGCFGATSLLSDNRHVDTCMSYGSGSDTALMKSEHRWTAGHPEDACVWTGVNRDVSQLSTCDLIAQHTL